ncbi:hypothetical protein JL720_14169 [Aureococcus anophagefferens]|nr:hypothetical protein JL720_14169 [Aureococcus anophagefferens]
MAAACHPSRSAPPPPGAPAVAVATPSTSGMQRAEDFAVEQAMRLEQEVINLKSQLAIERRRGLPAESAKHEREVAALRAEIGRLKAARAGDDEADALRAELARLGGAASGRAPSRARAAGPPQDAEDLSREVLNGRKEIRRLRRELETTRSTARSRTRARVCVGPRALASQRDEAQKEARRRVYRERRDRDRRAKEDELRREAAAAKRSPRPLRGRGAQGRRQDDDDDDDAASMRSGASRASSATYSVASLGSVISSDDMVTVRVASGGRATCASTT